MLSLKKMCTFFTYTPKNKCYKETHVCNRRKQKGGVEWINKMNNTVGERMRSSGPNWNRSSDHAKRSASEGQLQTLTGGVYALLQECCRLHWKRWGEEEEHKQQYESLSDSNPVWSLSHDTAKYTKSQAEIREDGCINRWAFGGHVIHLWQRSRRVDKNELNFWVDQLISNMPPRPAALSVMYYMSSQWRDSCMWLSTLVKLLHRYYW